MNKLQELFRMVDVLVTVIRMSLDRQLMEEWDEEEKHIRGELT